MVYPAFNPVGMSGYCPVPMGAGFFMNEENLSLLKLYLQDYLAKRVPGMIYFLNLLCTLTYRVNCVSLLLQSPSKLYLIILNHYRGDIATADYAFMLLFVNPVISYLKKPELAQQLLEYAKTGRDGDFVELIRKHAVGGVSS